MKLKFAGLLRSLLGQGGNTEPAEPARPITAAAPPPLPAARQYSDPAPGSSGHSHSNTNNTTLSQPSPSQNPEQIEIPLAAVVNALPMDLKAKLIETPSPEKVISLQVETVINQLAFGAVKITFGELRQLAPGTFVNGANGQYDNRQINLPLNEILTRINPALLARRPAVQKIEVAEEIAGPFGGHGRGVTFTAHPLKTTASSAATPARSGAPVLPTPPVRQTKPVSPVNFAPPAAPAAPTPAPRPAPPAPTALPKSEPIAFSPRQSAPLVAPVPFAEPSKPAPSGNNGNGNGNSNGNGSPVLPSFKFTAAPVPPPAAPVPPLEAQPTFTVLLKELAENWPNEIIGEIFQAGLANVSVPLPLGLVEPGLKRGRVTMTWKDLRKLINPNTPASPSDDLELSLPLKVIAPAFLAAQKKLLGRSQPKIAVSEEIPNLFFGFPQPETPAAPTAPAFRPNPLPPTQNRSAESSIPAANNPQNPNSQKVADTNLFSLNGGASNDSNLFQRTPVPATDFLSRQMQPKDVVEQALALPGVAGAVVALADGLRVAGQVPAEFNADTVAAFLPQIYERVNQSTRELRMGQLNNVSFTVGNVPWKIFRVNSIYFATFGRAGETFPKSQLARLAAGLDRKSK
jgi:predicted regulator of Ras-like GTPase activity (Roadblock/LC7/MglB family)